jgi:transcriptional regulator with XRE-family HTH domain
MKDLKARIAERFQDKNFEKKYLRTSALYRLAGEMLLLRKQRGLTQKELAEKVGTTQAVISRLESASVKPSLETILKIAEALDAAVDVRLLPVEKIRQKNTSEEQKSQKPDPRQGILYYDLENAKLSIDEKWISSQNTKLESPTVRTPAHTISLKRKIREYA